MQIRLRLELSFGRCMERLRPYILNADQKGNFMAGINLVYMTAITFGRPGLSGRKVQLMPPVFSNHLDDGLRAFG